MATGNLAPASIQDLMAAISPAVRGAPMGGIMKPFFILLIFSTILLDALSPGVTTRAIEGGESRRKLLICWVAPWQPWQRRSKNGCTSFEKSCAVTHKEAAASSVAMRRFIM